MTHQVTVFGVGLDVIWTDDNLCIFGNHGAQLWSHDPGPHTRLTLSRVTLLPYQVMVTSVTQCHQALLSGDMAPVACSGHPLIISYQHWSHGHGPTSPSWSQHHCPCHVSGISLNDQ